MLIKFFFIFLFSVCSLFSFELTRSVDKIAVTLGDRIVFKLKASKNSSEKLLFPGADYNFAPFELLNMRSYEERKSDNSSIEIFEYLLSIYELGEFKIPPLKVYSAKDTINFKESTPVEIIVKEVSVADTSDIIEIYGQENIGYGPLFFTVIGLVLLFLILAVYFLDKYLKRKKEVVEKPIEIIPPEKQFRIDMNEFKLANYLQKGNIKSFHLKLSEILRRYLGSRLNFEALESTTDELFEKLSLAKTESSTVRLVETFCELNDPVKFAKWLPPTDKSESLILIVQEIVNKTTFPSVSEK